MGILKTWKFRYALLGSLLVPIFGRAALNGTGHEHDIYRYVVPLLVGSVAGFLIGRFRDNLDRQNAKLRLEVERAARLGDVLRANEEYLRAILDNAPLPVYLKEAEDFTYMLVNSTGARITGFKEEEIIGKGDFDLLPEDEAEKFRHQDLAVMESDTALKFDTDVVLNGKKYNFVTCKFPLHDEEGKIYAIGGMCIDITEIKEAEKRLAEQEERLAVTLRNIGDAVIATDTEGRVVLVNAVAEKLTGWTQAEASGRPVEEVMRLKNEQGEEILTPMEAVLANDMIMNLPKETILVSRDGRQIYIEDSCAPIHDRASRIIGVVLAFRDVTRERQMEKELLKTKKLESLGVLAGGIAHDFNNILVGIMGNINLAIMKLGHDHPVTELLVNSEKASRRAQDLTIQLLTFAKGGEPVKSMASLPEIIEDAAKLMLHGSNVVASYSMPKDLWKAEVDTGQISQVIQNLVINARHAMPDGGKLQIVCENVVADHDVALCTGLPQGRYVRIRITDHGVGMPPNVVERIFDPYFSTKQKGSGLGLAIVHSIVSKHGGHISVESEPGRGTCFTIMLPAAREDTSSDGEGRESREHEALTTGGGTVLVMDDDEMVRDISVQMLSHLGFEVRTASNGSEAVEAYREMKEAGAAPAAVIVDLTIPGGMGGRECAKRIMEYDPEACCIVSSGYSNDAVMADYARHGFRAALIKPFNLDDMRRALETTIGGAP